MATTPPNIKLYLTEAKNDPSNVEEIEFSGATYQIKVRDPAIQEDLWVFLQFDPEKELQDTFCSCHEWENHNGCVHLTKAYLSIFNKEGIALHRRYELSFFHALGEVLFKRYGKKLSKKLKGFQLKDLSPTVDEWLKDLLASKEEETEENSLKFSNLSEEELDQYREGIMSPRLSFELSCWSDVAKKLFFLSENDSFSINWMPIEVLPSKLILQGKELTLESSIEEKDWQLLVPTLNTIKSELHFYNRLKDHYKKIHYDEGKNTLTLYVKEKTQFSEGDIKVGEYLFRPEEGFYPLHEDVNKVTVLTGEEIDHFLTRHAAEVEKMLNVPLKTQGILPQYTLKFDSQGNLLLTPYLFKKGDLQKEGRFWKNWAYLPEGGFYCLLEPIYRHVPPKVSVEDMAHFIRTQGSFLNHHEGFKVHLGSLKTELSYRVDSQGDLSFERKVVETKENSREYGEWTYIEDSGFYHKKETELNLPLHLGVPLRANQVANFIRRNRDELALITGFFFNEYPIEQIGLKISLDAKERIFIEPATQFFPKFVDVKYKKFEEWLYLEGKGFVELASKDRIPETYLTPLWIKTDKVKHFIKEELPGLKNWIISLDRKLEPPFFLELYIDEIKESKFHAWDVYLHYQTDRGVLPLQEIKEGFQKKKSFLFTSFGRIDLENDRFQWLKRLPEERWHKNFITLTTIELLKLHAFEEIKTSEKAKAIFQEIIELKKVPPFKPAGLQSSLRPYQEKGGQWMFSLSNYLLGGLLCDEMGLGKTHQSMALIAALENIKKGRKYLVVCPTSVLYHWEEKLKEFYPTIKVVNFHGPFRHVGDEPYTLLLTSYGILRNEMEWFSKQKFEVAIFDEIQVAKNHRSKLYHALQKVKAEVKFGLTGTPIENKLRELKTLFDIVLPGYMPTDTDYQKWIVRPIETQRDMRQKQLLHRLTNPFILRRRKKEVLSDLPVKTEEISYCDLAPGQEKLYNEVLLLKRDDLLRQISDTSKPIPFLHVFTLLTRLKQICDHPALYYKTPQDYAQYHSGKWDLFLELLQEARESEQKVVVYSQYLGMLDIIEAYLKDQGIGFASLRGSTVNRKEQIDLFAQDPACEVFVASLKAAGLGIDLTPASVVIHYDRWWNAARENQATDRVHRFGQNRGVQVFKLITKNTLEERIHQMILRKGELMEESIGVDDHDVFKSLNREEIYQLLQSASIPH